MAKKENPFTLLQLFNRWKLNRALLASKMGMPKGTFNNKLSDKHESSFSDAELIQLKGILRDMSIDIDKVTDIDFNAALGAILKSK